ncbi:CRISPR-associated endonuclease Cas1 [Streptomyces virginiae]|uniref:CRISPR-associated endonuclease Cas1 n=1 Tax=Streptomyces virginiae TaxID=1961 RepID=A0ABQ3NNV9_STRVG|nr:MULTISPECIES: type I-E CRISPR-associated endonuclease Cas1e [Streptomyces]GLV93027.1 CRISPR-associated endonuclease Cas1 [Streptomyces lavendulae subsp. lavendulae]KOU26459.1 CRISPR-associated protein Cse1 [Streptomyces sp. WM6349]KOV37199.1 CRISPR-associated protein Cse1 [Streptomyces sp. H036]MBP2341661.1 CRISPR-associated protein Cas1 [Streptomyces virginiae]MCI4079365.1 type I-E CRISPR-associated endonuclease Cas1e [Streptomyces sp. MMS21 TC-5]
MATVAQRRASSPRDLTRVAERISFIYLERCVVHREDNAITAEDADGTTHIPSATIGTLLLGPGTRITHQAMSVLADSGAAVAWVGEQGVRYYAGGRALTRSSALVEAQATRWANLRTRLDVARAMYRLRFPDEDPSGLTRKGLLGHEGIRVKECYRQQARRTGVPWHGRHYVPGDFTAGDAPNQAITAAGQCMYGVAHAVVAALGCATGLGFIHSGHELSFVLDVADLYKTEIGIPVAFDVAAEGTEDIGSRTRRALRDRINKTRLLDRCVDDIKTLLLPTQPLPASHEAGDIVTLQSDREVTVPAGRNYAEAVTW